MAASIFAIMKNNEKLVDKTLVELKKFEDYIISEELADEMQYKKCSDLTRILKGKIPNIPYSVSSNSKLKDKKKQIDDEIDDIVKDCKNYEQEMNGGRRMRKQKTNKRKTNKRKTK